MKTVARAILRSKKLGAGGPTTQTARSESTIEGGDYSGNLFAPGHGRIGPGSAQSRVGSRPKAPGLAVEKGEQVAAADRAEAAGTGDADTMVGDADTMVEDR